MVEREKDVCCAPRQQVRRGAATFARQGQVGRGVLCRIHLPSRRDESNRNEVASDVGITGSPHLGRGTMKG